MSFLNPAALLLLLIAVPITLLYVLRVRLRRAPVSSMMFWQQALADQPPRALWQRFRNLTSWLLQMLLLLLLVLGAAELRWKIGDAGPRRLVLVLDVSASMSATENGSSRLERARQDALQVISELSDNDEAAVVAAEAVPRILCGITSHQPTLRRAIETAEQTVAAASITSALQLAQQLTAGIPRANVIVFSDGCGSQQDRQTASDAIVATQTDSAPATDSPNSTALPKDSIEWRLFGNSLPNCGFTAFQLRRSDADPLGYEIFIRIRNASDVPVTCAVELSRDDLPLDVIPVSIEAGSDWTRTITKLSPDGGRILGELTSIQFGGPTDGLLSDNKAWTVLPSRDRQSVLLVSPGNLFVQKVLEANPLVDLTVWQELPTNPIWPTDTLIVLHELVPPVLPPRPIIALDPRSDCDLWKLDGVQEDPILETLDATSDLMRNVRLDQVLIPKATQLRFSSAPQTLAGAGQGLVLYGALKRSSGNVCVLAARLDESDLAFRTVFPILIANALNQLSGRMAEPPRALTSGESARLVLDLPEFPAAGKRAGTADQSLILNSPAGRKQDLSAVPAAAAPSSSASAAAPDSPADARWLIVTRPLLESGIWTVTANIPTAPNARSSDENSAPIIELAVNAVAESECDLRPITGHTGNFSPAKTAGSSNLIQNWFGSSLTPGITLLILCLLIIDWALHQRRWLN
jgi:hypothetical protein